MFTVIVNDTETQYNLHLINTVADIPMTSGQEQGTVIAVQNEDSIDLWWSPLGELAVTLEELSRFYHEQAPWVPFDAHSIEKHRCWRFLSV